MAVFLWNFFQTDIQPVLFENAGLFGQGQRGKARPPGETNTHFGFLGMASNG